MKHSETVPKTMQEKFAEISAITDKFYQQYLNEEYALMIRYANCSIMQKKTFSAGQRQNRLMGLWYYPRDWLC